MTFKIAKNELRNLFYSPVAWFITLIFFIQCAVFYTDALYPFANRAEVLSKSSPANADILGLRATVNLFLGRDSLFLNLIRNLYLLIPLLTMGLINREINNGSIKLLFSSPVKSSRIVLGKYLAVMLYNLLLVAIVGVFMVTAAFNIRHIDYGLLFSATLGFYLMACAYSAIGLYMSSLTTYPIVAAISTFTILFILSLIGGLWQQYDFVRDLTYFLSLQNRLGKMLAGLIRSRDVIYYLVIIYMFISFTLLKLRSSRESKPWPLVVGRYLTVVVIGLAIGYISSRPRYTLYWDMSATQDNTIAKGAQDIINGMDKDSTLEVTLYTNLLGRDVNKGLPAARNIYLEDMWDQYIRFKPNISFKYEYYYDYNPVVDNQTAGYNNNSLYKAFPGKNLKQIAGEMANMLEVDSSLFKSPEEMHQIIDLDPEGYNLVMQLKYKGRTEFLQTFPDMVNHHWPDLNNVAGAIKRLVNDHNPTIAYITGGLERNIYKLGEREYRIHSIAKDKRFALINIGFSGDTLNLNTQDIPKNITTVVLADPKVALSIPEMNKLKAYIAGGGNLLIAGEVGKQRVLNPLLQDLGITLMPGQLVQPTYNETPDKVTSHITPAAISLAEKSFYFYDYLKDIKDHKEPKLPELQMYSPIPLKFKDTLAFKTEPIFETYKDKSWLKAGNLVLDSAAPVFTPAEGDLQGVFITGLKLTRQINNKEQRILVYGDADFISNKRISQNFSPVYDGFSWLHYNQFPLYFTPLSPIDKIRIGANGADTLKIVYVWIVPALMLAMATALLVRRKRK